MNDLLPLPSIDSGVPRALATLPQLRREARLAMMFIEAGAIHALDVSSSDGSGLGAVQTAFEGWVQRWLGPLNVLAPQFNLSLHDEAEGRADKIEITCSPRYHTECIIGPALDRFDREAPGLAATVLRALDCQWCCPMFTPSTAFQEIKETEWMGENDETELVKEHCSTPEEEAWFLENIITRRDFEAAYPSWLLDHPYVEVLDAGQLDALVRRGGYTGDIAATVLRLNAAVSSWREANEHEMCTMERNGGNVDADSSEGDEDFSVRGFCGWGAVLHWSREETITQRVVDNLFRSSMEDGDTYTHSERVLIPLTRPDKLRAWMLRMRHHHRAVRLLDRLLYLIGSAE